VEITSNYQLQHHFLYGLIRIRRHKSVNVLHEVVNVIVHIAVCEKTTSIRINQTTNVACGQWATHIGFLLFKPLLVLIGDFHSLVARKRPSFPRVVVAKLDGRRVLHLVGRRSRRLASPDAGSASPPAPTTAPPSAASTRRRRVGVSRSSMVGLLDGPHLE
jgi:hypothetical protein